MHTILTEYIMNTSVSEKVSHAAVEFFSRVLCLHPPKSANSRLYYLSFLRLKFSDDLDDSFTGSRDLWMLYKRLIDTK
jgi:hypothetical protein